MHIRGKKRSFFGKFALFSCYFCFEIHLSTDEVMALRGFIDRSLKRTQHIVVQQVNETFEILAVEG